MQLDKLLTELSDIFYEAKALEFLIRSVGENPANFDALVPHEATIGISIAIKRIGKKALRIRNSLESASMKNTKRSHSK